MSRFMRQVKRMRNWTGSVHGPGDVPAALLLCVCHARPGSVVARCVSGLVRRLRIRPRGLDGFSLGISPRDMDELLVYEEIFIDRIYDLDGTPFVPDTVVDCGGFEGHFTLLARARFPHARFVVFEPNPDNYEAMCSNFERNGVSVDARRQAVSIQAGEACFAGQGIGGHLVTGPDPGGSRVKVADLCELIRAMSPRQLLLKLDVEGEEIRIIPSLIPALPRKSRMYFEWHHGSESLGRVEATLREAGFAVNRRRSRWDDMYVDVCACRQ